MASLFEGREGRCDQNGLLSRGRNRTWRPSIYRAWAGASATSRRAKRLLAAAEREEGEAKRQACCAMSNAQGRVRKKVTTRSALEGEACARLSMYLLLRVRDGEQSVCPNCGGRTHARYSSRAGAGFGLTSLRRLVHNRLLSPSLEDKLLGLNQILNSKTLRCCHRVLLGNRNPATLGYSERAGPPG